MPEQLGINYRLAIEVLTPLHIGNGNKLLRGFDFEVHQGKTFRLKEDVILNDFWPDNPRQQELLLGKPLSSLLQPQDYDERSHYFAYVLHGQPALREIIDCIKDPQGRPYLPGSSLKGAIRTAIMHVALERDKRTLSRGDIGPPYGRGADKRADDALDRDVFGPDPNNDLLRALHVGDSRPVPTLSLRLTRVRMVPGLDLDVEAIAPGTHLTTSLRVDTYLLAQRSNRLRWPRRNTDLVRNFCAACQHAARARLAHEYRYHAARRDGGPAAAFYARLIQEITSGSWPENEFLLQVGYAAGWRSKSVMGTADDTDPLLAQIILEFELDRGGKRPGKSGGHVQGQPFPKARHLAYVGGEAALPMGWLRVRVIPLGTQEQPAQSRIRLPEPESDRRSPGTLTPPRPAPPSEERSVPPVTPPPTLPPGRQAQRETVQPATETTPPPIAPGPHTGVVTYFNLKYGEGRILPDGGNTEIEILADWLRQGVRYLASGQKVSFTVVQDDDGLRLEDIGPV